MPKQEAEVGVKLFNRSRGAAVTVHARTGRAVLHVRLQRGIGKHRRDADNVSGPAVLGIKPLRTNQLVIRPNGPF